MNAVVIGGGPAGSLAATLLARAGVAVVLVEQSRFPRDKVCGECLSALGLAVLKRGRLDTPLLAAGRSLTASHVFGRHTHATLKLPSPMLGLSRSALDAALLDAARAAGADVRQPARAEAVTPGVDVVAVRMRSLPSNEIIDLTADVVFVADGRDALSGSRRTPTGDLGIKAHFRDVVADPTAITLYGGIGCYGGVAPVEGERWNVAFSVPRVMVAASRGDLRVLWDGLAGRSPAIGRHFATATRVGEWLAAPLPRHAPGEDWPARVVPIGAAACAIEPVGGEGMGTALRSAELAVEAVLNGSVSTLPSAYRRLWGRRGIFCRLGGFALADDALSEGVALANFPLAAWTAMRAVGK